MRIKGQDGIALLFGVTAKTINEWQGDGFPVAKRGGPHVPSEYEPEACINWLIDREVRKVQAEKPQDRLARAQADKIEMENADRRAQLIPAAQLEPKLRAAYTIARERWHEVAPRLARELPDDLSAREEMLQAEFTSFLHYLADWAHADDTDQDEG